MRELFKLDQDSSLEDYLNFLRSVIENAQSEKLEDREWARQDLAQILNLLTSWRSASLEIEGLSEDMDEAFDAHILSEWTQQPDGIFPEDHPLKLLNTLEGEAARICNLWISGQLSNEVDELIFNLVPLHLRRNLEDSYAVLNPEKVRPIFVEMFKRLRKEAFSKPQKELWDFFQAEMISTLRRRYQFNRLSGEICVWLEKNDFPELLEVIKDLEAISIPRLSCLIQAEFSKCHSKAGSDFASRVISALEVAPDPFRLSAAAALATVPKAIQKALEIKLESFVEKVQYLRALPLEYRIANLKVFWETFSEGIDAQRSALVPEYPPRRIWSATLARPPMRYSESLESRDAESEEQSVSFIDEDDEDDEDLFDHFNRLTRFAMEGYFPELAAGARVLRELETLNQTKPEDVRELKLKPFEHLSHKNLCEFVRRFPKLEILDLSEMELGLDEIANLHKAARWPETLRYRNAPDFPLSTNSEKGLVIARYTTFHINHFEGLRILDLSGRGFVKIAGKSDTLRVLNLEACSQLLELTVEAPKLRGLTLSGCASLSYAEMEKYASVKIFKADEVPQINIEMLCATYPGLAPFREELKKLHEDVQRKLHEHSGLAFSTFAKIEPIEDEAAQLKAIFSFILDQVNEKFIEKNNEDPRVLIQAFNSLWVHMGLLVDENTSDILSTIAYAPLEALIQYASSESYDPVQGAQLFVQLGGREGLTVSLLNCYEYKRESSAALGVARLLEFVDVNRQDVKRILWELFNRRVNSERTARLLVEANEIDEAHLEELCSTILDSHNECVDALALAVLKFPAAEILVKKVFSFTHPPVGFQVLNKIQDEVFLTALKALVLAGKEKNEHWMFLANLAQRQEAYRAKIIGELFQAENVYECLRPLIWDVVRSARDAPSVRLAALLALPVQSLNDESAAALVGTLDYYPEDISFRGEILKRLEDLGDTSKEIIQKIAGKSWPPGYVRNYLKKTLASDNVENLMLLLSYVSAEYIDEKIENTIFEMLHYLLQIYYPIADAFQPMYLPSGEPTEFSQWVNLMEKMIRGFLANSRFRYLSRTIEMVEAMPVSLEKYVGELASLRNRLKGWLDVDGLRASINDFMRRREFYVALGESHIDESAPEPKVIKGSIDPFPHLSPLLNFARFKVREIPIDEIQSTGVDRLREICYGLDRHSYNTPSQEALPVDPRNLLNWMKTNFDFCNAQVINWGCVLTVDEVLSSVVKIKNNKRQLQAPVVLWNVILAPEEAAIVIPVDNETCVYQFSTQYNPEITDELKKYFDIDETHCITLPYQNPNEFRWWFLYAAFMTLHTKSITHLNLFPSLESINALRFFFSEITATPEATIPAAERPFFKSPRSPSEKDEFISEEDDFASEGDSVNDNNASSSK